MSGFGMYQNEGSGGLFLSTYSAFNSQPLGNLDRLSSSGKSNSYDIFSSFSLPKLPYDDVYLSDDEENTAPKPRLPLFSRCPFTNKATLEHPTSSATSSSGGKMKSALSLSPLKLSSSPVKPASPLKNGGGGRGVGYDILGHGPRVPLLSISNQCNRNLNVTEPSKISYSQIAKKPAEVMEPAMRPLSMSPPSRVGSHLSSVGLSSPPRGAMSSGGGSLASPPSFLTSVTNTSPMGKLANKNAVSKPSLDDVKDDSLVALTNKHGKGKYWFKSGCPTPDPRWPAIQQLMIGPIPGDVEYSTLRSAFLSKGHTIHLFIQNNQAWLEKNQEKFGKKQVKFGYVVYTDSAVAQRLLAAGHVMVGHARVAVKEMDGQPAQFVN